MAYDPRPAIFGAFDGLTVVLGVIFSLGARNGHLVLPTAIGVALAEGIGMSMAEWLSESRNGLGASAMMGVATTIAAIAPALPYGAFTGRIALAASLVILIALAFVIAVLRARQRGWWRSILETYGILAVTILAVALVGHLAPGG